MSQNKTKPRWVISRFTLMLGLFVVFFQNCSDVQFADSESLTTPLCRSVDDDQVKPKLLWDWLQVNQATGSLNYPDFNQVMSTPMVADLNKDNRPEVIFVTFTVNSSHFFADSTGSSYNRNGVLRIVDGVTGKNIMSVQTSNVAPYGTQSPLLVDLDGDGFLEIIYLHYNKKDIVSLNHDGSLRWIFRISNTEISFASIGFSASDVNKDGKPEIIVGTKVISEDNLKRPIVALSLSEPTNVNISTLAVKLEDSLYGAQIINHRGVFAANGEKMYSFPIDSRYFAVADLYPEYSGLEIALIGAQHLYILNGFSGAIIVNQDLLVYNELTCSAGVVGGGPPSIGNFDASDPHLEIAIATGRHLTIFNRAGKPVYKATTQDCSSMVTGLSSFDLNGDKKPEILYADEEYFRIFEINNGHLEIKHKIVNPSGTLYEYPVVADINGDQSAEILVAANNYAVANFYSNSDEVGDRAIAQNITGVRAFTSAVEKSWMPTRPIWNQFNFHPDLFTDHGLIRSLENFDFSFFRRNNQGYLTTGQCHEN